MPPDPGLTVWVSICATPLQDAYRRNYASASLSAGPLIFQDTLQEPCLRIICKIHVTGSSILDRCLRHHVSAYMSLGQYTRSMPGLRIRCKDPCFRIHISAAWTMDLIQNPCLRILYKIHTSGPATRFTTPDPCLRIYVSTSRVVEPVQGPCLRILYKVHVSGFLSQHPHPRTRYKIHVSDPCLQIHA